MQYLQSVSFVHPRCFTWTWFANYRTDTSRTWNFVSSLRNSVSSLMLMQPSSSSITKADICWKIEQTTSRFWPGKPVPYSRARAARRSKRLISRARSKPLLLLSRVLSFFPFCVATSIDVSRLETWPSLCLSTRHDDTFTLVMRFHSCRRLGVLYPHFCLGGNEMSSILLRTTWG